MPLKPTIEFTANKAYGQGAQDAGNDAGEYIDHIKSREILMPDITTCSGEGCKLKDTCYRYTASPNDNDHQSYFLAEGWNHLDGSCKYYLNLNPCLELPERVGPEDPTERTLVQS